MRKIILIITILLITGVTALSSAVICIHYLTGATNSNIPNDSLVVGIPTIASNQVYYSTPNINEGILEILVNNERGKKKIKGLEHSDPLCGYAELRRSQIVEQFDHEEFNKTSSRYMIDNHLIGIGENLSEDTTTNENTIFLWMNSPTHKANILDPRFTQTCVKCDSKYCVQIFAEPRPTNP